MDDVKNWSKQVDFGIIAVREDEFEAVLERFEERWVSESHTQRYEMAWLSTANGQAESRYLIAMARCLEDGNSEAQRVATDFIRDLDPQWLLLVGIAGGRPDDDFSLGDVVVSTRFHDFRVHEVRPDESRRWDIRGTPLHRDAVRVIANLPGMRNRLSEWSLEHSIGLTRPSVTTDDLELFYGDENWINDVRESLRGAFESPRRPRFVTGPIASGDILMKNVELLAEEWLPMVRKMRAVEMESAGVAAAANAHIKPLVSIRGISDVIGYKRDPLWTRYACNSAASFTVQFLRHARPVEPRNSSAEGSNSSSGGGDVAGEHTNLPPVSLAAPCNLSICYPRSSCNRLSWGHASILPSHESIEQLKTLCYHSRILAVAAPLVAVIILLVLSISPYFGVSYSTVSGNYALALITLLTISSGPVMLVMSELNMRLRNRTEQGILLEETPVFEPYGNSIVPYLARLPVFTKSRNQS